MDEKTLEALKGSIKKWEGIVAGTGEDRGIENCPLCQVFYAPFIDRPDNETLEDLRKRLSQACVGCPVYQSTGLQSCEDTPYDDHVNWDDFGDGESKYATKQDAAIAELEFLKSLLPEEAK